MSVIATSVLSVSIFCKTLQAHQDKSDPNLTGKHKEPVVIYFHFQCYGDKGFQLTKSCICKIKVNCKDDQPVVLRSYRAFVKWSSFATPKTELLLSINLLLCTISRVLVLVQSTWIKPKKHISDVLNTHGVIKTVL